MAKKSTLQVKGTTIRTLQHNGIDYICITDIARQKNPAEPKDVVKNWMRLKNTLEYLGLWEQLNNPAFKGVEFDPLLAEAGSNAFTMSPSRWVELTGAVGILSKNGAGGGTYAQRDIAFKFASWVAVEFELYLVKEFQRLKRTGTGFTGMVGQARTLQDKLPHPHRCHQAEPHSGGSDATAGQSHICQRGRRAECRPLWHDCARMAQRPSRPERQYPRLCRCKRTDMPVEHGKPERSAHQRRIVPA